MSTTDTSTAPTSESSFGENMDRLEAIVTRLEGDEALDLEEAIAVYEQALSLAAACRAQLANAQLKLTQIPVPPPSSS